ncbi:MAG: hypothetical protein ACTSVM_00565, partial [Candidatus Ranarchaeia archaeon]
WSQFNSLFGRLRHQIKSISAYDRQANKWIQGDEVLESPKNYELIIITLLDSSKMHVQIKDQEKFSLLFSRSSLSKPHVIQRLIGFSLSADEERIIEAMKPLLPREFTKKVFLERLGYFSNVFERLMRKIKK